LDIFFSGAKEVLEAVTQITKDVREKKDNFFEATFFMEVPGAKMKHAFPGMFLACGSVVSGDISALKAEWLPKAPFVRIDTSTLPTCVDMVEAFTAYALALEDAIVNRLPDLVQKA